jgi:hypothetical protein
MEPAGETRSMSLKLFALNSAINLLMPSGETLQISTFIDRIKVGKGKFNRNPEKHNA